VYVLLTLVTLAIFTALFVFVRLRWRRLSLSTRKICIAVPVAILLLSGLRPIAHWEPASDTLTTLLEWCRDLSYIFLVLLFTLLRPRWLSMLIAFILIVPILSASILLPLGDIFNTAPAVTSNLGHNLQSVKIPFYRSQYSSGVDITVYYRPAWLPIIRHKVVSNRFFNTQCNTADTFAVLETTPQPTHILVRCPALTSYPSGDNQDLTVPLR
jgi:hypothetical protein